MTMRNDGSNNRVAIVVIGGIVAAALVYCLPVYGYRDATARTEALRARYEEKVLELNRHENARVAYLQQMDTLQSIAFIQDDAQMKFPKWTDVPRDFIKDEAGHIGRQWVAAMYRVESKAKTAEVEILDTGWGLRSGSYWLR